MRGHEVEAAAIVLAVRVHGAGGLVYGLVDDVVLQLIGVGGEAFYAIENLPYFLIMNFINTMIVGYCDTAMHYWIISKMSR